MIRRIAECLIHFTDLGQWKTSHSYSHKSDSVEQALPIGNPHVIVLCWWEESKFLNSWKMKLILEPWRDILGICMYIMNIILLYTYSFITHIP